jgi:hypothetical protein
VRPPAEMAALQTRVLLWVTRVHAGLFPRADCHVQSRPRTTATIFISLRGRGPATRKIRHSAVTWCHSKAVLHEFPEGINDLCL